MAEGSNAPVKNGAKTDGGKDASAVNASAKRDAAADGATGDAEPESDFAGMLAAKTEAPAATVAAPAPRDAAVAGPEDANSSLPDQLLALLSGSLVAPVVTNAPATAAPAPPTDAGTSRSMPATPAAAMPFAFASTPTTTASTDASIALPVVTELAAAALNGDGDVAAIAVDASPFDNTLFAAMAPSASPLRADAAATVPGPPLALPDNPDAGFGDGIGARIAWMAEQRVGHAEIRLNPEHVGPIEVRVQLDGTRVNAEFHSAHADVRQAIEASVPRLREMLGQQGLQLGHADVGQRNAGQGQRPMPAGRDSDVETAGARPSVLAAPVVRSRGLLDEYA